MGLLWGPGWWALGSQVSKPPQATTSFRQIFHIPFTIDISEIVMQYYLEEADSDQQPRHLSPREGARMNAAAIQRETAVSRLVSELKAIGGLKGRDLANMLGVSPPTVTRWSKGEAEPTIDKQTAMAQLRWVADRLADFYQPDEVRLWLQSAHPQLRGERPYDLIVDGRTAEVLEVIERLDSGVYL